MSARSTSSHHPPSEKERMSQRGRHASRDIMAVFTAIAGFKLGMTLGSTVNNVKILYEQHRAGTLMDNIGTPIWNAMVKASKLENPEPKKLFEQLKPYLSESTKSALIAGVILAVPAAIVGWNRGSRIEHPWDLVHHPIDSVHRLIVSDTLYNKLYSDTALTTGNVETQPMAPYAAATTIENRDSSAPHWTERVNERADQAEHILP